LTSTEEKALAERICQMTVTGYLPTENLIYKIAYELRQYRLIGINDDGIQPVVYEAIGPDWVKQFMKHHPQLKIVYSKIIEVSQVKDITYDALERFYNELRYVNNTFKIRGKTA